MKKGYIISLLLLLTLVVQGCTKDTITYQITPFVTNGDQSALIEAQSTFTTTESSSSPTSIQIDTKQTFQVMDGFGAALTESSAYVMAQLPEEKRNELMQALFSSEGIGIDFLRLPMGSSDFALDSYTYNDSESPNEALLEFSIARDEAYVIPILKAALALNPELKLMASPWSAPAWMKTNNRLSGGSLNKQYYEAYANYFVKFIEAYEAHGLPIYAITVQNEPLHETTSYPSMYMSIADQIQFIKVLGEAFDEHGIDTRIIGYDHNWDNQFYPQTLIDSPIIESYIDGVAFHCYNGSVADQKAFYEKNPLANIWFTECTGISTYRNFSDNITWNMDNIFIGSVNAGSKSALLWNLALDEAYGPQNGGCTNCVGVVTTKSNGTYQLNEEYYIIGHFSKFIDENAVRISVSSTNMSLLTTGFLNEDGTIVVVIHNKSTNTQYTKLVINGEDAPFSIKGKQTVTLEITHG